MGRNVTLHYSGRLRIVRNGTTTMISAGLPVCMHRPSGNWTVERAEVTCKRCLRLIAQHDETARTASAKGGVK